MDCWLPFWNINIVPQFFICWKLYDPLRLQFEHLLLDASLADIDTNLRHMVQMCVETTRWPLQLWAAGPECCRVRAAGLWFNSWFDPPCAGSPTLPGYLWQMPLYRGRSLQPIHGCCGMRLPRRFWPARSKPLGSRSVVSRFAITLNDQTSVPEPGFTRMDILRATLLTFGIVWPTTRLKEDQFIPPPVFCTFFFSPFLLHHPPALSLQFALPLPSFLSSLLCRSWTDLFGPQRQSEWESTRLYLSAAWMYFLVVDFGASVWVYLLAPAPPASSAPASLWMKTSWELLFASFNIPHQE